MALSREEVQAMIDRVKEKRKPIVLEAVTPRVKAKGKTEPKPKEMNGTEKRYAAHLEKKKLAGEILWYRNHGFSLYFEEGTRYSPDFVVMDTKGEITLYDTKAYRKNKKKVHITEASMARMKRTAHEFWMFTMVATWEVEGSWNEMVF